MLDKILDALSTYNMLSNDRCLTVALSGGADSVSLLYCMLELKDRLGLQISAIHINHMLRGSESDRDELFVRKLCSELSVPLTVRKIDVSAEKKKGESIELAARRVRYEAFESCATGVIATAHTADDFLETMVFNISRGTALNGLCGIPAVRGRFIRPLLFCTRHDVEQYCDKNNIEYVTDSTNLCDCYSRNKIRHYVIPVLKQINPSVCTSVVKNSLSISEDNDFIEDAADKLYKAAGSGDSLNADIISATHAAVAKRAIKHYIEQYSSCTVDSRKINLVYDGVVSGNGKISLESGVYAVVADGLLSIESSQKQTAEFLTRFATEDIQNLDQSEKINILLSKNTLDYDKIVGNPVIRSRITGDKIRLAGRGVTKSLKKLYNEYGIPHEQRDTLPVIADMEGIVWIHGFGPSERVAPDKNTKKVLIIDSKII